MIPHGRFASSEGDGCARCERHHGDRRRAGTLTVSMGMGMGLSTVHVVLRQMRAIGWRVCRRRWCSRTGGGAGTGRGPGNGMHAVRSCTRRSSRRRIRRVERGDEDWLRERLAMGRMAVHCVIRVLRHVHGMLLLMLLRVAVVLYLRLRGRHGVSLRSETRGTGRRGAKVLRRLPAAAATGSLALCLGPRLSLLLSTRRRLGHRQRALQTHPRSKGHHG